MSGRSSILRLVMLLLLCVALSGCSALKLAYDNADTYLIWRADRYLALRGPQHALLTRAVRQTLAWHRQQALPIYATLADEAAMRLARGLKPADIDWAYTAVQTQWQDTLQRAAQEVAPLLDTIDADQLVVLEKRFAEDNRTFAKDFGLNRPEAQRRKLRVERNAERLSDWLGSLTDEQRARIQAYSAQAPLDGAGRDRERQRLQQAFLRLLRERQAQAKLVEWVSDWSIGREPEFERQRLENWMAYQRLLLELDALLSPAQRDYAVQRLRDYAQDFRTLAAARS